MTTVSVIIPTWNRSASLERAVRSALAQTRPPLEVLVCDDGSTDESEQMIRSLGDSRVIWLPGTRAGRPAIPRNRGIHSSKGEWLAFLDDDDVWHPEKLELQLKRVQESGCFASCSDAYRIVPGQESKQCLLGLASDTLRFEDVLDVNLVICSSVLASSVVVKMAGGFPESSSLLAIEDYALWLRLLTMTDIAYVAQPLLEYRDAPQQSIRQHGARFDAQRQAVLDDFCAWATRQGSGYLSKSSGFRGRNAGRKPAWGRLLDLVRGR